MLNHQSLLLRLIAILAISLAGSIFQSNAQSLVPADWGTVVNGYQDDFEGTSLQSGWAVRGASVYSVNGGILHMGVGAGDPNHLLYEGAAYNSAVQEVLVRMRVTSYGSGDGPRGGPSTVVDASSTGINYHFRNNTAVRMAMLDDKRGWGTEQVFTWQTGVWYWLRMRHEVNAAAEGGANDAFGKIWLADGTTPEPVGWQYVFDYTPLRTERTGFAGLASTSNSGQAEYDVDYILIKASGLPSITASSLVFPATQMPVAITNQPVNTVATESLSATLSVGTRGFPTPTLQWYRNAQALAGATNSTLVLTSIPLADNGTTFRVVAANVVSNVNYSVTSAVVTLTVNADTLAPALLSAQSPVASQVQVLFTERVTGGTATNTANYTLTGPAGAVAVQGAIFNTTQNGVILSVPPLIPEAAYTLAIAGIQDISVAGNTLASTQTVFVAGNYVPVAIGGAAPAGSVEAVSTGFQITGGGADLGGTNDQFQFAYQTFTGDFDFVVRLESLELSDLWAEAGLVARENLTVGARFASVMATPGSSGIYFQTRTVTNATATLSGRHPVNYPYTWLRLRRAGATFSGYASYDGQRWSQLSSVDIDLPTTLYFGLAVSSHNNSLTTRAVFRDFALLPTAPAAALPEFNVEPLGQASRRTPLVISEIMYNPFVPGSNDLEFVELYNSAGTPEDLSGYRLSGDVDYWFPTNTVVPGGGYLVVARTPADVQAHYGISGVLGPYTNSLPNNGGRVRLRNPSDAIFLEVNYGTREPWPEAADGNGHSLVLRRPSLGQDNPEAWGISGQPGGSPSRADAILLDPLSQVVVNEFLANSDVPLVDFVELYNRGTRAADLSGCWLSDRGDTNKFRIPDGTLLNPGQALAFTETQMGFNLSAKGEAMFLRDATGGRVLDLVRFEGGAPGISIGRSPDGAVAFHELVSRTPGTNNAARLIRDVVINEIMFRPLSGNAEDEFVELHNRGTNTICLGGWTFFDGIQYTFPTNAVLSAGGFVVVGPNPEHLMTNYPGLTAANTFGGFSGSLANAGERVALAMPLENALLAASPKALASAKLVVPGTNLFPGSSNWTWVVVDEVAYRNGGRWGQWSDAGGSSLELVDPAADNRLAANWADSDETAKAPWTSFTISGLVDNGITAAADQLQVLPQGAGEWLLDDVEVLTATNSLVASNGSFTTSASGWVGEGTLDQTGWDATGGVDNSGCLHLRAVDRGDNQMNRVRSGLTSALTGNQTATIRFKARWLKGDPELVVRLRGCYLEGGVRLPVPANAGTPGATNSRRVLNAAPAVYEVAHAPLVPAANEPVVVTARAHDAEGIASLVLNYRVDPGTNLASVTMLDDGTGGDALAGDGIYSATMPGLNAGFLAAFHVEASDPQGAVSRYPADAPIRECLVRFGDTTPAGNFPLYRLWMTAKTFNTWSSRHKLNNTPNDVTFVLGNTRAVYNLKALFAGSPYIAPGFNTPAGNRCGYSIEFPADDLFLGGTALVLDWPGGHGGENTAVQEQMAYTIAAGMRLPYSYRHFIRLHVNGVTDLQRDGVFEAVFQPGSEYVETWEPANPKGEFYKIDRSFEYDDSGNRLADPMPRLVTYPSSGANKVSRYRWTWLTRAGTSALDYSNLLKLVDAANATNSPAYTALVEGQADIEQWMRVFAFEHIVNNFDSWGHIIGKNMYMFKPDGGRWVIYPFDLDWLMLVSPLQGSFGSQYLASNGPLFTADDPVVLAMYNHPPFRRAYFRAVEDAVNGPLLAGVANPAMDARYKSLVDNGVNRCDGQTLVAPDAVKTWFAERRVFLQSQLAAVNSAFAIQSPTNGYATNNNNIVLRGIAPVTVKTITVNGVAWPVTWTALNNWMLLYPVSAASNSLTVAGLDLRDLPVSGASKTVDVLFTGQPRPPQGTVKLSEIMYNPVVPEAGYVELYNTSTNTTYDLSYWRIEGLDYTFPPGTVLTPTNYLVLVKNREVFTATFPGVAAFDEYPGSLQNNGEILTLLRPGAAGQEEVVNEVRYDSTAPWPDSANGSGASLQVVDLKQDNTRVANWSDSSGWRFATFTGNITGAALAKKLILYPDLAGDVYLDDLSMVAGSVPGVGTNLVPDGSFENAFLYTTNGGVWTNQSTYGFQSHISTNAARSGRSSMHLVFTNAGSTVNNLILEMNIPNGINTLSFWYLPTTNLSTLTLRFGSLYQPKVNVRPVFQTPGTVNSGSQVYPALPPVWLNEVAPGPVLGTVDNLGEPEPWMEIHNSSTNAVDLGGLYLTDNYTNLTRFLIPAGTVVPAQQFLVIWADGETNESAPNQLHTSFRLAGTNGSVALVMLLNDTPKVLDYLDWKNTWGNRTFGAFPDGQAARRRRFDFPSPGQTNNPAIRPVIVRVNEWMSDNTSLVAQPPNSLFEDWFELYNAGDEAVDLTGWHLTDNATNWNQFRIPSGYAIPAFGHLLVWADNAATLNTGSGALHVNFRLSRSGEAIGLFDPNGVLADLITFGPQARDGVNGRYPDGSANVQALSSATPGAPNLTGGGANTPPTITPLSNLVAQVGETVAFTVAAMDADQPPQYLVYDLLAGPAGATLNPTNGSFRWLANLIGQHTVTIRVTDSGSPAEHSTASFQITVPDTGVNHAPIFNALADQSGIEGVEFVVFVSAVDPDGNTLTYTLEEGPNGATLDGETGRLAWLPTELDGGIAHEVAVAATDGAIPPASSRMVFYIQVMEHNRAPVIGTLTNLTLLLGQKLSLAVTVTDPDLPRQNLTLSLLTAPAGATVGTNGALQWTPGKPAVGTNQFLLRAVDDGVPALSATNAFAVIVAEAPQFASGQVVITNGEARLTFNTVPGKRYQVEYTPQLGDTNWTAVGAAQTATGATLTVTHPLNGQLHRFYRINAGD